MEVPVLKFSTLWMEKSEPGVVVPMPTFPELSTINLVAVEEPITKDGVPIPPRGLIEKKPHGLEVATPTWPFALNVVVAVPPNEA